jgi:Family of unknown function (DUF6496)
MPTKKKSATKKSHAKKGASKKSSSSRKSSGTRKYSPAAGKSVEREMKAMKRGKLKSGRSGKKVTSRKQAIAIGLSEARKSGAKVPKKTPRNFSERERVLRYSLLLLPAAGVEAGVPLLSEDELALLSVEAVAGLPSPEDSEPFAAEFAPLLPA